MYSVFANDLCIYDDISPSDKVSLINPKLTLADNSAGSFSFIMPPGNVGYDTLYRIGSDMSTPNNTGVIKNNEIVVKRNDIEIWSGRIITEEKDYWNRRKFECEGELAYLNDILQPPAAYDDQTILHFLNAIISIYNSRASANRQFTVGAVTVLETSTVRPYSGNVTITTNYSSTWDVIKTSLLDVYGGHIRVRKVNGIRYLDYLDDFINTNTQEIDFHQNLTDFTRNWDDTEFCTVVIPYGKKIEDKDDSVNGLSYSISKTRNSNNNTYSADFKFTFNNPGVPSDYYVDILDDEGNVTGQQYGSYDHFIYMRFWPQNSPSSYWSDTSSVTQGVWTLAAGSTTDKSWSKKVDNLVPNTTYVWRAWVCRKRSTAGGGTFESQNMGGVFDTGEHTMTASLSDGEVDGIEKHVTVESVNNGSKYVENQNGVTNYGRIETVVTWDTIDDPQNLLTMANWYLTNYQFNGLIIQLSALDMHYLNPSIEAVNLLDNIRVISTPHGLDKQFPITKLDIPLDSPDNTIFTLGDKERESYTKSSNKSNAEIYEKLGQMPTTTDVMNQIGSSGHRMLVEAQDNAKHLIEMGLNGYITITSDEHGTQELWITPTQDYTQANSWWRWNMGGLGYGYKDANDNNRVKYKVAITMDGAIVADRITTGTMLVDRVRLYGLMGVYKQAVDDSNSSDVIGGYVGYGQGARGADEYGNSQQPTDGIMISNTPIDEHGNPVMSQRYFIATTAGVRMTAGEQAFYITDNSNGANAALLVRNRFTLKASAIDLYPPVYSNLGTKDTASHGTINIGNGYLIVNKGFIVGIGTTGPKSSGALANIGGYTGGSSGNEIQLGRANITVVNGMVQSITPWTAQSYQNDLNAIINAIPDVSSINSEISRINRVLNTKADSDSVANFDWCETNFDSIFNDWFPWITNWIKTLSGYHGYTWD